MRNEERAVRAMPMPMVGIPTGKPKEPEEFVDRRRGVTPLVFEAVERRRANLEQAGIDLLQQTARAQEEAAILEGLVAQVKAIPAQMEAVRAAERAEARAEWEASLRQEREAIARACAQFGIERERYFSEVEEEVVRLALAVAARVLHREAQIDPMLLAASVRLALEKLGDETGTTMRVPVETLDAWKALFKESAWPGTEVIGDERLAAGECVLETNVGRVELGVSVQLEEIEKGFFDLLQKRPS